MSDFTPNERQKRLSREAAERNKQIADAAFARIAAAHGEQVATVHGTVARLYLVYGDLTTGCAMTAISAPVANDMLKHLTGRVLDPMLDLAMLAMLHAGGDVEVLRDAIQCGRQMSDLSTQAFMQSNEGRPGMDGAPT